jgi:hypothetical protein
MPTRFPSPKMDFVSGCKRGLRLRADAGGFAWG